MSNGSIWVDPMETITKPSLASERLFGVFVQSIHCVQWIHFVHWLHWTSCPLNIVSMDTISKGVQLIHWTQWIHWTKTPNWCSLAKLGLVIVSIGSTQMDPLDIHWTCLLNIGNGSVEHHWTSCPMKVHWTWWIQWIHWTRFTTLVTILPVEPDGKQFFTGGCFVRKLC